MKDLALAVVKGLADHPDKVAVQQSEQADAVLLKLTVCEEDKGKIIGKQGKVIKAMRTVLSCAAGKQGKRVRLELE